MVEMIPPTIIVVVATPSVTRQNVIIFFLLSFKLGYRECRLLSEDRREDTSDDICGRAYAEHYITECDHINSPFI